jgi:SAM-dependent methyltransferase
VKETQNIFDDPVFFDGYRKLRDNPDSANILEEKPALFSLAPVLRNKSVLDLGCGFGENCSTFYKLGAKRVTGLDISENMLKTAQKENAGTDFIKMDMNDLSGLHDKYDVVFSSLAIHYIEDLDRFAASVHKLLNAGGYFIFSQEHPLTTAPIAGAFWVRDESGNVLHYRLTDYAKNGGRKTKWIIDDIIKYHRTFSTILNTFISNDFIIEQLIEPVPTQETLSRLPDYEKDLHKPNFLLIRMKKAENFGR